MNHMHDDSRIHFPDYIWPEGKRCAVTFSMDLDAESPYLWIHRGQQMRSLGEIEQRRYGPRQGVKRVVELLAEYGISGSFFVPGVVASTYPGLLPYLVENGHEIAYHGYYHERIDAIGSDLARDYTEKVIEVFRQQTGQTGLGYRAPSWEMTIELLTLFKELGISYDSSLMGFDHPYDVNGLVEIPTQWMTDDALYFRYTNSARDKTHPANPVAVLESWIEEFEGARKYGGLCMLTIHDWISGRPQRLLMLEKFIRHIRQYNDVWIARADELARWHQASANHNRFTTAGQHIQTQFPFSEVNP
ncbi:polysaccharide deacetylase family protein [Paracandidimonas soli]|uniref:Peptidoglycan/xylan/chitin deacetylase (PgdA/CDA1 family) n=1 Tax=Paracandidimonas soli TaxID=1917182 RepID=A0A4R3V0T9_9BURK|nr:polysaccharide deacetylase [Paracandidimonas soli]TCU98316.1 peptidoglycan/xylan/chitin deacetylase (PgdA/CDA1 family) [Paracandidimonas soli]